MDDTTTKKEPAASSAATDDHPIVFLHGVSRRFRQGDTTLDILKGAELALWAGQSVALVAPSGAGKSTLLHLAGLLEHADAGEVYIDAVATSHLSDMQRTRIRRADIGFVYQFHHLLPEFSAVENVMLPQMIRGLGRRGARARAVELLTYLGLKERLVHRPAELSGGEQQRVAIARAVANAPRILLADEPTGNLDVRTSAHVFATLNQLVRASGLAAIIATHNLDIAAQMDRRVTIRDGAVVEVTCTTRPKRGAARRSATIKLAPPRRRSCCVRRRFMAMAPACKCKRPPQEAAPRHCPKEDVPAISRGRTSSAAGCRRGGFQAGTSGPSRRTPPDGLAWRSALAHGSWPRPAFARGRSMPEPSCRARTLWRST